MAAVAALGAGCGGSSPSEPTGTLPVGVTVGAQGYVVDVAAAAQAARAIVDVISQARSPLRPPALRALAPRLAEPAARLEHAAGRVAAERLADTRLEAQRRALSDPLSRAAVEARSLVDAARVGDVARARADTSRIGDALDALRTLGAP